MNLEFLHIWTVLHHVREKQARDDSAVAGDDRILNSPFHFLQQRQGASTIARRRCHYPQISASIANERHRQVIESRNNNFSKLTRRSGLTVQEDFHQNIFGIDVQAFANRAFLRNKTDISSAVTIVDRHLEALLDNASPFIVKRLSRNDDRRKTRYSITSLPQQTCPIV